MRVRFFRWSALLLMLIAPSVTWAQDVPVFHWVCDVRISSLSATTPCIAPLDSHFFQQTRPGWPDMRMANDKGEAVASVIRTAKVIRTRTVRRFWSAEQRAATVDEATGLQVELNLRDKEDIPGGLRIISPLKDFRHRVQVESSADGTTWTSVGPPGVIFDYSRHVDARNDLIEFNADKHRLFRITIADLTSEQDLQLLELQRRLRGIDETERTERKLIARRPFRIDRIDFYRDDSLPEGSDLQMTPYPANNFATSPNDSKHQTILTFTTQNEPITEIRILTDAENFSRTARIEAEISNVNDRSEWQPVSTGTISRFAVGTIQKEELTLKIVERQQSRYRIAIENRDSPPLSISGVELSGPVYELAFLASPGQNLRLEYGSPNAPAGNYDSAALKAALKSGSAPSPATLDSPRINSNAPKNPRWAFWNDSRVLVVGIIVVASLLGWGLFRAGKRIDAASPPQN